MSTPPQRDLRTNKRIRARDVRVVGAEGEQLGVLPIDQALSRAQAAGLDLVEINPMSKPPVCKIMDYGKFKYEEKKRQNETRKKQVVVKVKEVKMRPRTEDHDYDFKVRNAKEFVEEGNKVRFVVQFRGREITHRELGQRLMDDIIQDLKEIAIIEAAPRMEGKLMFMIMAPNAKVAQKAREVHKLQIAQQEKEKQERRAAASSPRPSAPGASAPVRPSASTPAESKPAAESPRPIPPPAA